jgi:hypothetical protein
MQMKDSATVRQPWSSGLRVPRWRGRFLSYLMTAATCTAITCVGVVSCRAADSSAAADRLVAVAEASPGRINSPALVHDESLATLLDQVRLDSHNIALRRSLAAAYAKRNSASLAAFFRATVEVAESRPIAWPTDGYGVWACGGDGSAEFDIAHAVEETLRAGSLSGARVRAEQEVEKNPGSCLLRLCWAHAVMTQATMPGSSVNSNDRELAIRTWLTFSEEGHVTPAGFADLPSAFIALGQYFSSGGDMISALTAYRIGKLHIDASATDDVTKRFLDERIRIVGARVKDQ